MLPPRRHQLPFTKTTHHLPKTTMAPPPMFSTSLLKSIAFPPSHPHPPFLNLTPTKLLTLLAPNSKPLSPKNSIPVYPNSHTNSVLRPKKGAFFSAIGLGSPVMGSRKWVGGGKSGRLGSIRQFVVDGGYGGEKEDQSSSTRLLTLPTVLTLGRIAVLPLLVSTYYMNGRWATTATTSIFLAAAFTDWLDGYIARKMRMGTAFGAFLDPVADKLMVAATLVLLCTKPLEVATYGEIPWLLAVPSIAIIGREITMSAVREWAAAQNPKILEAVAVNSLGKWKTATQMTALTILLATRDPSLAGSGILVASGVLLLYISSGLALWSLTVYMRNIWRILFK